MSDTEFDDDVTVDVDEALLARIRVEAARRAADSGVAGGTGDAGEVHESTDEATQDIPEEVLESIRGRDFSEDVPAIDGYGALREIGRGGFSRVYEALEFEFQRWVAIKVINETLESDEEMADFERECRLTGVLSRHPNIVTVLASALTSEHRPCIVMELFPHGSYLNILQRMGPLSLEELLPLAVRISGALATAHRQGMVHGDVKPQNIFRSEFGDAALGDFGIATLMHQRTGIAKTRLSLYYAAPELIESGVAATSPFADQYSLAATIYTLATGLRPFQTDTGDTTERLLSRMLREPAPRLGREFPKSLDDVLWQAMASEPQDRHRDVVALAAAIAKVEQELGFKPTEIPITRDAGRYVGHTPGPDTSRSTTASRSQDSPATPPTRTGDRLPDSTSREQVVGVDSRTVVRPMTLAATASLAPEPEQSQEKPRIPLWAKIGSAVAAIFAAVVIILLIATGGVGGEDVSATVGENRGDVGVIIFSDDRDGDAEVFVMDADGTNVRQLTDNSNQDGAFGWVTAGDSIVFTSDRDGDREVFVMDADGANVRQLTDNEATDWGFGTVTAGESIVFTSDRDGDYEVFVMDADGANARQLTDNEASDWGYGTVTAGESIVFTSDRDGDDEVFVMNADGANVRQLTDNDEATNWGFGTVPAGESIVFTSYRDGDAEVFVMDADGANARQLTQNTTDDRAWSWSPDRRLILFTSYRDGDGVVFVMDADGTNVRQLTNNEYFDS